MANIRKHGTSDRISIQPDRVLEEKSDGTIEGTVTFSCDKSLVASLPQIGAAHPDDTRCVAHHRSIKYGKLDKVEMTASYFGLVSAKTDSVLQYNPSTDRNPIASHPKFKELAGTESNPINGAKFDPKTGEFLGFFNPDIDDLFGVEYYLEASTAVSLTYWQNSVPSLRKRMSIVNSVPGFRKPTDCKDFLLLDFPYRQIGPFYQVTELYLGSGEKGWSTKIYG